MRNMQLQISEADVCSVVDLVRADMRGEAVRFIQGTYSVSQEEAIEAVDGIETSRLTDEAYD